jgi:hypothetical protein
MARNSSGNMNVANYDTGVIGALLTAFGLLNREVISQGYVKSYIGQMVRPRPTSGMVFPRIM